MQLDNTTPDPNPKLNLSHEKDTFTFIHFFSKKYKMNVPTRLGIPGTHMHAHNRVPLLSLWDNL